ncbi:MAG: protein kinase [Nitriliruptor sp.]|uniref:serine/threonine-protein kinase n=1 Tax=Nitriliruptor sp. TaxID=2448056 RepID=UPI00349FFA64
MATRSQRGRILADRYELRDRLGTGGAGTVWRGHDRALDRPVAVKLLHAELADDPDAGTRFRIEATAAAKLTHPNAVLVYDLGRDGDDDYLVMELVEGVNLADVLRDGPLDPDQAAAVGKQVAGALGTAHQAGIVHRDVKPANILLTAEGVAKLADFGIARALGAATSRLTRTGMVLGTARYLAPEQLRDDPIDARADVYALGLVLHEVLTGRAPFGEGNAVEVAARRLTTSLPPIDELVPDLPPGLDEVIDWATRIDPRERPEDGAELARALAPFAAPHNRGLAARIAQVPARNTTPVASDRIAPIDAAGPAPAAPDRPLDPGADAAPAQQPLATDTAPDEDIGSTRAIDASDGSLGRVPSVAASPPEARTDEQVRAHDATSTLAAQGSPADPVSAPPTGPSTARRWVLAAVAGVAVLLIAIGLNTALTDRPAPDGDAEPTAGAGDPDREPLAIVSGGDHDPEGDRSERGGDVDFAFDGDPETYWPTETYNSADFGGFDKAGVGIWLELETPTALERVEVELSNEGGSVELWASPEGPPADDQIPDGWGTRLGGGPVPAAQLQFPNLPDTEVRTVLVWFTDLPEGGRRFRAEVREVRVFGR